MKNIFFAFLILPFTIQAQTWTTEGSAGFTLDTANYTSIAINGSGTPYVVYVDAGISDKATVMEYIGGSWDLVGIEGFSAGRTDFTSIAIDASGTPYVVYQDWSVGGKATVMKYNGGSWVMVGIAGFSAGTAANTSIAIDGSGTPYVVYEDGGLNSPVTVMKFNGSIWVNVGSADFSAGGALYTSIAIDGSGTPYVVYSDNSTAPLYKATVKKYNGTGATGWETVGVSGFSAGMTEYTTIAVNSSGMPYVVYSDAANSYKTTVMDYDGSSWVNVGSAGFSPEAQYTTIAIDGSGTPYVAYQDWGTGDYSASVMKYNGSDWVNVGSVGFSISRAVYTDIAIDGSGTLYVAYQDQSTTNWKATVMKFGTPPSAISGAMTVCTGVTTTLSDVTSSGTWSSGNTTIATIVSATGVLTGVSAGTVTISYVTSGGTTTSIITVNPPPNAGSIVGASSLCADSSINLTDGATAGAWSSSNASIATVNSSGMITGIAEGSVTISYSVTNTCGTASATQMLTVNPCTTGIENISNPATPFITIFPNPNNGFYTINISTAENENAQIIITNILGEEVKELRIPTNKETGVQLQTPAGIYFISAVTKNESATNKIVIE